MKGEILGVIRIMLDVSLVTELIWNDEIQNASTSTYKYFNKELYTTSLNVDLKNN